MAAKRTSSSKEDILAGLPKRSNKASGNCPNCLKVYYNARKPANCDGCGFHLGGSFVPKAKKESKSTEVVKLFDNVEGEQLFSVRTTSRNNRCFVIKSKYNSICYNCLDIRAGHVNSERMASFTCKHVEAVTKSNEIAGPKALLRGMHDVSDEDIQNFTPDAGIRTKLCNINAEYEGLPLVIKVDNSSYVTRGVVSSGHQLGLYHVRELTLEDGKKALECSPKGADCKNDPARSKKATRLDLCIHFHLVHLMNFKVGIHSRDELQQPVEECPNAPSVSLAPDAPSEPSAQRQPEELEIARESTLEIQMKREIPYHIPITIFDNIMHRDTADGNWPATFEPENDTCLNCGERLGKAVIPRGQSSSENCYLLTNHNALKRIKILVKYCQNKSCRAMNTAFPIHEGLFNVCNKLMVSLDIMIHWREQFKTGSPITNVIEAHFRTILSKTRKELHPTWDQQDYLRKRLYDGFYGFEVFTNRNMDDGICGICGIVGEIYSGDGNEKICCSTTEITDFLDDAPALATTAQPPNYEGFKRKLKRYILEKATYAKTETQFKTSISEIPPVIAPSLRGTLFNTEAAKKSIYLDAEDKNVQGDPSLLILHLQEKKFEMNSIITMDKDKLKEICSLCKIPTDRKSSDYMRMQLQKLYASIIIGNSPCHTFTKAKGRTGGFYHIVCRHGCTVASKMIILTESVRDAADLFLSLKYPPILFICDTPCTLAQHMRLRDRSMTDEIFGDLNGCFEKPTLSKKPTKGVSVPALITPEYRDTDAPPCRVDSLVHPVSKSAQRYIMGDRFHNTKSPHKSPLCRFHNVNLCEQAASVKTSYQESRNKAKKDRRIRSACVQDFPVHYLYNELMDFYQNERIVEDQKRRLLKNSPDQRDDFHRFIIKKVSNKVIE